MRILRTVFRTSWLLAAGLALVACSDRERDATSRAEPGEGDRIAAATPETPPAPDNTARNARDADGRTLTPEDQSNQERDLEIARSIREAVTSNDALSNNAQNVKIITQDAVVTLRGPVKSEQEQMIIVSIAQQTPGVARVDDQLEVDPHVEVETEFEHEYEEEEVTMDRAVFGIVKNLEQAESLVLQLQAAGFSDDDVSVLLPDEAGTRDFAHEQHTKAPEGATAGVGIPEYEAKRYEGKLREGNILISVHTGDSDERDRAKEIFENAGAEDVRTAGEKKVR